MLDFFDGFFARLLKVSSPIGKDLDSLADMVTFGVVPGLMIYKILALSTTGSPFTDAFANQPTNTMSDFGRIASNFLQSALIADANDYKEYSPYLKYFALIIPIFSCIRLARFNNDTRQSESFIGLPTPSNAMVICSLPLIVKSNLELLNNPLFKFVLNPYFLCTLVLVFSLLLVAEIPLFALKFKNFGWAHNKLRYVFLVCAAVLIAVLQFMAVPLVIILYILMSIVNNIVSSPKSKK